MFKVVPFVPETIATDDLVQTIQSDMHACPGSPLTDPWIDVGTYAGAVCVPPEFVREGLKLQDKEYTGGDAITLAQLIVVEQLLLKTLPLPQKCYRAAEAIAAVGDIYIAAIEGPVDRCPAALVHTAITVETIMMSKTLASPRPE